MKSKETIDQNSVLMAEWDYSKNDTLGLDPKTISLGSAKKAWWKCSVCGNEWEATPNTRSQNRGCPNCAQKARAEHRIQTFIQKNGSLADNNPNLAKQWNYAKNGKLTPQDVTVNSAKYVWWSCSEGHEWRAPINSRNSGVGCPVCSGHKVVVGVNDLATVNPTIAAEWHPTKNGDKKPTQYPIKSGEKIWWLCEKGHEWEVSISNRSNGTNCPICAGKKVLAGFNDLASQNPRLAMEWNTEKNSTLTPQDVTPYSNKKVWWKCSKGHEWLSSVSIRSYGKGCPICAGEMRTSFPEQAIFYYFSQVTATVNRYHVNPQTEIDVYLSDFKIGIEYDGIFYHSSKESKEREKRKDSFLREQGIFLIRVKETEEFPNNTRQENVIYSKPGPSDQELADTIHTLFTYINESFHLSFQPDIDISRDRSRILEQYILNEKEKSLSVVNPSLASEWNYEKNGDLHPEYMSISSNRKVWWRCKKGHEWSAVINSRSKGVGCPICSDRKVLAGFNDLATVNPTLAKEWNYVRNGELNPQNVTVKSNRKVWWICEKGHEWETLICDRSSGTNCPVCAGKKVLVGFNDLVTTNPKLASEWHPTKNANLTPNDVTAGSDKKIWWTCSNGHEWSATISSRNSGCGCPYCSNQKTLEGYNDLATTNPKLASEWHPSKNGTLKPCDVAAKSKKKVWWICERGHAWRAALLSRNNGCGCPYCSGQKIFAGYNDLETLNPKLAAEWNPNKNGKLKPCDVAANSNKRVWWICEKGHEWENSINSRNSGHKCPYCANQKILEGYNDLATTNPRLASEWHPTKNANLTPKKVMAGTNKKAWWKCSVCGNEWEAMISSRNRGHGCPKCSIQKRSVARRKNILPI